MVMTGQLRVRDGRGGGEINLEQILEPGWSENERFGNMRS